jgi:uncharacterized membrane protein YgdD (TMEM256/DUF423 family)
MDRFFVLAGAILGFVAVLAGAFGAHALRGSISPDHLVTFETGVRYQMYHALALVATAWVASRWPGNAVTWAGRLFLAGTLLFSGSLYLIALTGTRGFGIITPFGGVTLLAGWLFLALAGRKWEIQR